MDYLTGHIRSAWLLAGCSSACFSPVLLPSVPVWQLAHLIYLIGLVQSVGNVLKANQGDGGTSAGDIVSRVWKEVEQLQDGPPRLTCPGSTLRPLLRHPAAWDGWDQWRRLESTAAQMSSTWPSAVHACFVKSKYTISSNTTNTAITGPISSCLCAETWQANTLNVLQDDNISGWTGQHRAAPAAPAAPWWSLMWHTWAN